MSSPLDKLIGLGAVSIQDATRALAGGGSLKQWRAAMERAITTQTTSAFITAFCERTGIRPDPALISPARLSRAERAAIKAQVADQLRYLDGFVADMGRLSPAQIMARAMLYSTGPRAFYYAQRWAGWEIPDHLLPGRQRCKGRCLCTVSVQDNGDGTGVLVRVLGRGEADHCDECPPLAGEHAVQRRGGAVKEWDDGEIDTWDDDGEVKHLPGGHDQRTHGRSTGRRTASRAAYARARAGGASVQDARVAARDMSRAIEIQQRLVNLRRQEHAPGATLRDIQYIDLEKKRLIEERQRILDRMSDKDLADHDNVAFGPEIRATVTGRQVHPKQAYQERQQAALEQKVMTPSSAARDAHRRVLEIAAGSQEHAANEIEMARIRSDLGREARSLTAQRAQLVAERQRLDQMGATPAEKARTTKAIKAADQRLAAIAGELDQVKAAQQELGGTRLSDMEAIRQVLAAPGSSRFSPRFADSVSPEMRDRIRQASDQVSAMTNTTGLRNTFIDFSVEDDVRAYAQNDLRDVAGGARTSGRIVLDPRNRGRIISHEIGHHIEYRNPDVLLRANTFLGVRTKGEEAKPLAEITGITAYRDGERARPDRFIDAYMGKDYGGRATELISMGVEYLHTDPVRLAREDPEYFMFMYDTLRPNG